MDSGAVGQRKRPAIVRVMRSPKAAWMWRPVHQATASQHWYEKICHFALPVSELAKAAELWSPMSTATMRSTWSGCRAANSYPKMQPQSCSSSVTGWSGLTACTMAPNRAVMSVSAVARAGCCGSKPGNVNRTQRCWPLRVSTVASHRRWVSGQPWIITTVFGPVPSMKTSMSWTVSSGTVMNGTGAWKEGVIACVGMMALAGTTAYPLGPTILGF